MEGNLRKFIDKEVLDLDSEVQTKKESTDSPFKLYPDYESAKHIFRVSLKNYKESGQIYTLDDHASEHIELQKDLIHLWSHCLLLETGTTEK